MSNARPIEMKSWRAGVWRGPLGYVVQGLVVGIIYVLTAKLSLGLASINPSASPVWPPTGVALASMLLLGPRVWPAILIGAFIVNVTTAGSLYTSIAIAGGNTLESVVGAFLINRWCGGANVFDTPTGIGRFAAICLVPSTFISATTGVLSLSLAGYAEWQNFVAIWLTWWMGDLAGALLITPVIVLWSKSSASSLKIKRLLRSGAAFGIAAVIGLIAFSPFARHFPISNALAFLSLLPLMWTALHHDQRDTATTVLIIASFAVWGVRFNSGPFIQSNLNDTFLLMLAFIVSISVPSLALSANTAVQARHADHIETVMLELSHRSKNLLAVVQSIAHQSARRAKSFEDFDAAFSARIRSLAGAHDLLVAGDWQGAGIHEIIRKQIEPFVQTNETRLRIEGPELVLKPKAVEHIGLALHELATNASKYGALSLPAGWVSIHWRVDDHETLVIDWSEHEGPAASHSHHRGFGHMVITHLVPRALQGTAELNFTAVGLAWRLAVPAINVLETPRVV